MRFNDIWAGAYTFQSLIKSGVLCTRPNPPNLLLAVLWVPRSESGVCTNSLALDYIARAGSDLGMVMVPYMDTSCIKREIVIYGDTEIYAGDKGIYLY